jgi:hypothetical protein
VRHHDPDEADQAADADHSGSAHGRGDDDSQAHAPHLRSQRRGLVVADSQHVEVPSMQQQHRTADHHVRQHQPDVVPVGRRQASEDPAVHLTDDVVVPLQHERLDRGGQRGDRNARQDERDARATGADR